jgi:hypothetical protein
MKINASGDKVNNKKGAGNSVPCSEKLPKKALVDEKKKSVRRVSQVSETDCCTP